jgi:3-oxoacyl-[acyl-carrier protein] reductase
MAETHTTDSPESRVALVTGATRGIGRAIAEALAANGNTVIGTATSEEGAAAIDERLAPAGGAGMRLNVADADSVAAVMASINERFGAPLILVNNAGITRDNILMRMKEDEWPMSSTPISTRCTACPSPCCGA